MASTWVPRVAALTMAGSSAAAHTAHRHGMWHRPAVAREAIGHLHRSAELPLGGHRIDQEQVRTRQPASHIGSFGTFQREQAWQPHQGLPRATSCLPRPSAITRNRSGPKADEPKALAGSSRATATRASASIRLPALMDSIVEKAPSTVATSSCSVREKLCGASVRTENTNTESCGSCSESLSAMWLATLASEA